MILENCSYEIRNYFNENVKNEYFYLREDYAKRFVNLIKRYGGNYSLFQIRRKGKTTFLKKDFAKIASKDFYVFYYSFMKKDSPENIFFDFKKKLFEFVYEVVCKNNGDFLKRKESFFTKLGFKILGSCFEFSKENKEIDFNETGLDDILNLFNEFKDKSLIMLLDEFQELGNNKKNESFVKELRTELDLRDQYIHCVFTGSSYNGLEGFFSKYNAPLFQFGTRLDFEDLPDDFISFCSTKFNENNPNLKVKEKDLLNIFYETGKFPLIILDVLKKMEINQNNNPYNFIKNNELYSEITIQKEKWISYNDLEKLILYRIVNEENKISGKESIIFYEKLLKTTVSENQINYVLKKLKNKNIILKDKQNWKLVDFGLSRFIKDFVHPENIINN